MNICILDKSSMGEDTPFDCLYGLGNVSEYAKTDARQLPDRVADVNVIVTNKVKIGRDVILNAEKLKLICVFATGYDNIDIEACKERGIAVCNVPGYSTDSVTLMTVTTALSLVTKISEYNEYVRSGEYTQSNIANKLTPVYHELKGKTWGIVGYGNIGKAVAKVARAFGMNVIVNKKNLNLCDGADKCVDIDTLCKESDIISLHCPLTRETRKLINSSRLSLMKKSAILINEARGDVVDELAVADAIINSTIAGYGCDVYSTEPFDLSHPYNRIMKLDNVILTPHAAWAAYEARERCVKTIAQNINSFFDDKLLNRVDI